MNLDQLSIRRPGTGPPEAAPGEPGQPPFPARINTNAALPNLSLALLYALAAFGITLPFMDRHWLGTLMGIEFLVIHSFPFMMLAGSVRPGNQRGRNYRRIGFWGLFIIYFLFAADMGGLPGLVGFAALTAATYLGYLLRRTSPDALAQLAARWVMSFLVFVIGAMITGVPKDVDDWPGNSRAVYFGLSYFLVLGILEAGGFYQRKLVRSVIEHLQQQFARNWRS